MDAKKAHFNFVPSLRHRLWDDGLSSTAHIEQNNRAGPGVLGLATTLLQISPFDGHFPGSLFVYFRPFHSTFAQKYCFLFQRDSNPLPPSERFDLCSVSDHSFRS